MNITLHKNARTTPLIRKEIQSSSCSTRELSKRYNITEQTVLKWRKRTDHQIAHMPDITF